VRPVTAPSAGQWDRMVAIHREHRGGRIDPMTARADVSAVAYAMQAGAMETLRGGALVAFLAERWGWTVEEAAPVLVRFQRRARARRARGAA
jgi:hypothetical protein